jgi:hypothetical protein
MADELENHTLRLLREMREEMRSGFNDVHSRLDQLDVAVAAVSADLKITKEKVESIDDRLETIGGRMNSVERRLARIEAHTGMVKA